MVFLLIAIHSKRKQKITRQTGNGGTKDVEISKFWRTLEMPLINCKITLQLTCSKKSILAAGTAANQVPKFKTTDTKLYVPVVILSTYNIKLVKQLESGFKRTINWNKYQSKKTSQAQNRYLDFYSI